MRAFERIINRVILNKLSAKGKQALTHIDDMSKQDSGGNEKLLLQILRDNADTEYGKKYDFAHITSVEQFKEKVPFSEYDTYAPYIERMVRNNESNLITAYPVEHYAVSSGSVGVPKHIPVSRHTLDQYANNSSSRFLAHVDEIYRARHNGRGLRGKGLNTMEVSLSQTENGISLGPISGAAVADFKKLLPYVFTSPLEVLFPEEAIDMKYLKLRYALEEPEITFMTAAFMTALVDLMNYLVAWWPRFVEDIRLGRINPEITISDELREKLEAKLRPNPQRADVLEREFSKGFDTPIVPRIWPDMCCVGSIGAGGFIGHTERMRSFLGPDIPIDFMVYAASEALMAAAPVVDTPEYALITDACFYEFVPMDSDDEDTTYTIDQLEVGKEYEIIITNCSGFYRYRIKDVIRVLGWYGSIPLIAFVYRKNQLLSIAGEKTNDEAVLWAVQKTGKECGYSFADYCVYPDADSDPGHYVVLLEPDRLFDMNDLSRVRDVLDDNLGEANSSYGKKVATGVLGPLEVKISQLETHALYRDVMTSKGISPNQIKPVRLLDTPMKEKFFFCLVEGV